MWLRSDFGKSLSDGAGHENCEPIAAKDQKATRGGFLARHPRKESEARCVPQ
jgi:hypothetical protein